MAKDVNFKSRLKLNFFLKTAFLSEGIRKCAGVGGILVNFKAVGGSGILRSPRPTGSTLASNSTPYRAAPRSQKAK